MSAVSPRSTLKQPRDVGALVFRAYLGLVLLYLCLPILVVAAFGFNDVHSRFDLTWRGFTLNWYEHLLALPDMVAAVKLSLLVAFGSALIATALGTPLALALTRYTFRGRGLANVLILIPLAMPSVVIGAALLSFFVAARVARGTLTIVASHVMFDISFVVIALRARLVGFDPAWEDSARDLGASPWITFWTITFPLLWPGLLAAFGLAFALSIDDLLITSFVAGPNPTFPLWIYGVSRFGIPPQTYAVGTVFFVVGLALAFGSVLIGRKGEKHHLAAPAIETRG